MAIIIAFLTGAVGMIYFYWQNAVYDKQRYKEIAFKRTIQYLDEKGRTVTETTEQRLTIQELQDSKDSIKSVLLSEISRMNIKLKNVESLGIMGLFVHDTAFIYTPGGNDTIRDTIKGKFYYKNDYLSCVGDSNKLICDYKDSLVWSINKFHWDGWKLKNIFCWREWTYKLNAKFLNSNASINFSEYYRIQKKKRTRE